MITLDIPGYGQFLLKHLVLDYNGTLARDGILLSGVKESLNQLSKSIEIHVITADTFGEARAGLEEVNCDLSILPKESQDTGKQEFVKQLGSASAVCIGNGRNDRLMLKEAALGIAVILEEGAAAETLLAADVVCTSIHAACELLTNPLRLVATLRS
jgi:soluble P-type ATPase